MFYRLYLVLRGTPVHFIAWVRNSMAEFIVGAYGLVDTM